MSNSKFLAKRIVERLQDHRINFGLTSNLEMAFQDAKALRDELENE